jgi:serine/threonine-protein kinase
VAVLPGTRIGPYEVTGQLGEGGMGVVCRARDTKLQREVALKVLPDHLAGDPDRHARLEREAQLLASLNHPHIAQVYGLEQADGLSCIVMELVEGPTLADRIAAAPTGMLLDDVVPVAAQIVSALEAAHGRGIVHRDLKPANIKITTDGQVKVLDFGLATADAKAVTGISGAVGLNVTNSPTVMATSMPGVIMGTLAYMSPEQARGTTVDSRTDVWAFGCVLCEMLTGRQAFVGETPTDIVAKIVTTAPDWDRLPAGIPSAIRQLLRAALDKDPKKRLQHIGDARLFLELGATEEAAESHVPVNRARRIVWPALAATFAFVAAVAGWFALKHDAGEPNQLVRLTMPLPADSPSVGRPAAFAVSRDGSRVVFRDSTQLYLRTLSDPDAKPISGTVGGLLPTFSPNGDEIAFVAADGSVKKVPLGGGTAVTLADRSGGGTPSWGDDGNILVATGDSIRRVPASGGGKPAVIATADVVAGERFTFAELLPGGKYVLTGGTIKSGEPATIAIDVRTGEKKDVLKDIGNFSIVPTGKQPGIGHLVYRRDGEMFAAAFDANTLTVGAAVPLIEVMGAGYAFSHTGRLFYRSPSADRTSTLVWVDREGKEQPLSLPADGYLSPRLTQDGQRLLAPVRRGGVPGGAVPAFVADADLYVYEPARTTRIRVTFGGQNTAPVWMPGDNRLIYRHADTGEAGARDAATLLVAADGGSPAVRLWTGPAIPYSISREGVVIASTPPFNSFSGGAGTTSRGDDGGGSAAAAAAGSAGGPGSVNLRGRGRGFRNSNQLWLVTLGADGKPVGEAKRFLDARFFHTNAEFSPDGKWIAFQSNQNQVDQFEIYVVPFPAGAPAIPISSGGGDEPRWNSNGRELFYRSGDKIMAVDVTTSPTFRITGAPRVLFEKASAGYDVAANGAKFLIVKPVPRENERSELQVVLNWFDDLRRRVPLPE